MKREHLLAMASRGWHLFPIQEGRKKPALVPWSTAATNNAEQITKWHDQWPNANWGVATGPSDLLVVDVDNKGDKNGSAAYEELQLPEETFTVSTPTGGKHYYFQGVGPSTVDSLARGLDTRGVGGYVLLAGSTVGGQYTLDRKGTPAAIPERLRQLLAYTQRPAQDQEPAGELDTTSAVENAREWLRSDAPVAVEGDGGDHTTYQVAARCRDRGLSEGAALEELLSYWNGRCSPPWDPEELERKVANAYRYAKGTPAAVSPTSAFEPIAMPKKPKPEPIDFEIHTASEIDPASLARREWILDRRFIAKYLTVTVAPGGVGKSTHAILECLAIATGLNLTGDEVRQRGSVWYYNTEDPFDEIDKRVSAALMHAGIDRSTVTNFHWSSGRTKPIVLVDKVDNKPAIMMDQVNALATKIRQLNVKVFVIDPFVRCHRVEENDNQGIDLVVQALTRVADLTGCAIHAIHHTRKRSATVRSEGDMDTARGASALVSAARFCHTLCPMSEEAAEEYGIDPLDRHWFVRMDDAKGNMVAPDAKARWYRRCTQMLPCGEGIGTLQLAELAEVDREAEKNQMAELIYNWAVDKRLSVDNTLSVAAFCRGLRDEPELRMHLGGLKNPNSAIRDVLPLNGDQGVLRVDNNRVLIQPSTVGLFG